MSQKELSYSLRLKIHTDEKFFGPGVAKLLRNVDITHSLVKASEKMSMAYTKALKIIKKAEDSLSYKLLIRKTGGNQGGGSHLTPNAYKLLELYDKFEEDVGKFADNQFEYLKEQMKKLKNNLYWRFLNWYLITVLAVPNNISVVFSISITFCAEN